MASQVSLFKHFNSRGPRYIKLNNIFIENQTSIVKNIFVSNLRMYYNKDDNIHKSEALNWKDR